MKNRVILTILSSVILGGGCLCFIHAVLKDKDKYANRILHLFDDREEETDDSDNR